VASQGYCCPFRISGAIKRGGGLRVYSTLAIASLPLRSDVPMMSSTGGAGTSGSGAPTEKRKRGCPFGNGKKAREVVVSMLPVACRRGHPPGSKTKKTLVAAAAAAAVVSPPAAAAMTGPSWLAPARQPPAYAPVEG
jgi:hypothetical protein